MRVRSPNKYKTVIPYRLHIGILSRACGAILSLVTWRETAPSHPSTFQSFRLYTVPFRTARGDLPLVGRLRTVNGACGVSSLSVSRQFDDNPSGLGSRIELSAVLLSAGGSFCRDEMARRTGKAGLRLEAASPTFRHALGGADGIIACCIKARND